MTLRKFRAWTITTLIRICISLIWHPKKTFWAGFKILFTIGSENPCPERMSKVARTLANRKQKMEQSLSR